MELPELADLPAISKFIERILVTDIGSGASPRDVTIQLPDSDGAKIPARYTGFPPGLAVNDEVTVRATPQDTIRYVITGASGASATKALKQLDHVLFVSTTAAGADYATIAAANTAASAGDIILLDAETWGAATITKAVTLMGLDPVNTILTTTGSKTISMDANDISLRNLTIANTGTGSSHACVQNNFGQTGITIDNCVINKVSGASTTSYGIYNNGGTGWTIHNTRCTVTAGTTRYGYRADTNASSAKIIGGSFEGSTDDISLASVASISVELNDPILENGDLVVGASASASGKYLDGTGDIYIVDGTEINTDVILSTGVTEVAPWYDFALNDSSEGEHFRDNTATFPTTWTESDAPASTNTSDRYSFWKITGTAANASWDYRKQSGKLIGDVGSGKAAAFPFGPIIWRDGQYTADLDYFFGIYSDTGGGAIDTTIYIRFRLQWNSGSSIWRVRGEESDGAASHQGAWFTFAFPVNQPIWVNPRIFNNANKQTRASISMVVEIESFSDVLIQNPTTPGNWDTANNLWLRMHQSRGAGVTDFLYIGAQDFVEGVS